ncbi:MAG: DNA alkylation repair protein [Bacteroidales bacterium]|nr:DNA alkylation repair protein [Bacteroidales bacterium]
MIKMTSQQYIQDIRAFCLANANKANAEKYSRYFKEGLYNGYGLSAPMMYEKAKEILAREGLTLQVVMESAPELIRAGKSEEISIMMMTVRGLRKHFTKVTFSLIEKWFTIGIDNWAHADTLGGMLIPEFMLKGIIGIEDLNTWLKATNKYQRRCVPVTLIKTLKTTPDYKELFRFIECLMTEAEREVHQGTGWFLREAWKKKPEATETFLMKWKDTAPRLIFQYATEKMTAAGKASFRRKRK